MNVLGLPLGAESYTKKTLNEKAVDIVEACRACSVIPDGTALMQMIRFCLMPRQVHQLHLSTPGR